MDRRGMTPNNNGSVIRMLSAAFYGINRGRNRILLGAAALSIVTLTMVFGISCGKIQAESISDIRRAGTAASAYIETGDRDQYAAVKSLGYVKSAGRRVMVGAAGKIENAVGTEDTEDAVPDDSVSVCDIRWLDDDAWKELIRPAYTEIHGSYPQKEQEILLSKRALKALGIGKPEEGMEIPLRVSLGLFRQTEETFILSGWFTDYAEEAGEPAVGYISREKLEAWGYDPDQEADILFRCSDHLSWREAEARLYQDIQMKSDGQKITVTDSAVREAVTGLAGGYAMAVLGTIVILCGMYFLVHNVMQISVAGDIRQMGLLNTIGTTEKQIRKIYYGQIRRALIPGSLIGTLLSSLLLLAVIPHFLGDRYLRKYGGGQELRIFRPEIMAAAVLFTVLLILGSSAGVIRRAARMSCAESVNYTGLRRKGKKVRRRSSGKTEVRKRSAVAELIYMARRSLTRNRARFLLTVFSLFLGTEMFLGAVVITSGSDYVHVIEGRPDFLIAGQFSSWGQELGCGREYESRDAGEDPMLTEGDGLHLLYDNDYDEFSPISPEVREKLLGLDGVDRNSSYVMVGAYLYTVISAKGIRPMENDGVGSWTESDPESESRSGMVEGALPDVIQILSDEAIRELSQYAEEKKLSVDMESLADGTGVMLLHDHVLSQKQEQLAEESVGEKVYFKTLMTKSSRAAWNRMSPKERDVWENSGANEEKRSEDFTLCGYLDNRAEDFPKIRQTWHGAEGSCYFLISEAGFRKIPTEKKTLYMELNVEEDRREPEIKSEIENIVSEENQLRAGMTESSMDGDAGEAGIFVISKSDLMADAADSIRGSRLILGSISAVLLCAGLTNYFNVMITGILSRKKEFEVMESIGMTLRQKRCMLFAEGMFYCLSVTALMLTAGSLILWLIRWYMEQQLSYFVFSYPLDWIVLLTAGMTVVCAVVPVSFSAGRSCRTASE